MHIQHADEVAILEKFRILPSPQKAELVSFLNTLVRQYSQPSRQRRLKDLAGLWQGLDIDISPSEIRELRAEMWKNFPREMP